MTDKRSLENFFRPEDFYPKDRLTTRICPGKGRLFGGITERANALLREYIKAQPVVYFCNEAPSWGWKEQRRAHASSNGISGKDTHTARLVCIEEIKK